MTDAPRIPLFVRMPPCLKDQAAEAAWRDRMSLARFVEEAVRDRLRKLEARARGE